MGPPVTGFFERWSRNKRSAEIAEPEPGIVESQVEQTLPEATEADVEFVDEEAVKALPSLDEITPGFDIKPFLKRGIPRALKNAALRKTWLANPAIRDHKDVAVDYWWDWNTPGGVPGNSGQVNAESAMRFARNLLESGRAEAQEAADAAHSCDSVQAATTPSAADTGASEKDGADEDKLLPQLPEDAEPVMVESSVFEVSRIVDEPFPPRRHGSALPE